MPKFMNNRYTGTTFNLQLFAGDEGGDNAGEDSGEGDDQDDGTEDDADEGGDDEAKFTKKDIDAAVEKAVARTIAKERRKAEKSRGKSGENKGDSGEDKEKAEAITKASNLEVKVACYEQDVAKDSVDDVAALARAYMAADENLDLEDAIEKVVKKYPQFKKKSDSEEDAENDTKGKSWGERQKGRGKKVSGVEAAFMKRNPGIKID